MSHKPSQQQAFAAWSQHTNVARLQTESFVHNILREAYPAYHVVRTVPSKCDLLAYATAGLAHAERQTDTGYDATRVYRLPHSRLQGDVGRLEDVVNFGRWHYQWQSDQFVVYEMSYVNRWSQNVKVLYLLTPNVDGKVVGGYNTRSDELLMACGQWTRVAHQEIWVFDNSQWSKNKALWKSVQDVQWEDLILDPDAKASLDRDVHGFFSSQVLYQKAKIPWKRGIIFHGVPGNGKTLSIKALIKAVAARSPSVPSLYVKSLDACAGPRWSIRQIFQKARRTAPCLLILEDLDSLVSDDTRSYFLNEVDGLESNDGILMVGSTNHIDKLDPALTKRPSRFDRKYHFQLPTLEERTAYCRYWCRKVVDSGVVSFPEVSCVSIAELTDGYSFAYLQELFVTSLLLFTQSSVQAYAGTDSKTDNRNLPESNEPRGGEGFRMSSRESFLEMVKFQAPLLRDEMNQAIEKGGRGVEKVPSAPPAAQYSMAAPLDEGDFE